jgi:hypothetical protein
MYTLYPPRKARIDLYPLSHKVLVWIFITAAIMAHASADSWEEPTNQPPEFAPVEIAMITRAPPHIPRHAHI